MSDIHDHGLDLKNRIIYIHHLGGEDSINWQTSSQFVKNLDILTNANNKPITIKLLGSDGGDLSDGLIIYSAIKRCQCHVTLYGYGYICSAATIFMQAADKRYLSTESEFMIHHGSIYIEQSSIAARSAIQSNIRNNKLMLSIYSERCVNGNFFKERKYSLSRVRKYLDNKIKNEGDVWLIAQEAVDLGFADDVF
jgi:ATP-dependent protease ClpP protease subunit